MSEKIEEHNKEEIIKKDILGDTKKQGNDEIFEFVEENTESHQNEEIKLKDEKEISHIVNAIENSVDENFESKNEIEKKTENEKIDHVPEPNCCENEKNNVNKDEKNQIYKEEQNISNSQENKDNPNKDLFEFTEESNNHIDKEQISLIKDIEEKQTDNYDELNKNDDKNEDVFEFTEDPDTNTIENFKPTTENIIEIEKTDGSFKEAEPVLQIPLENLENSKEVQNKVEIHENSIKENENKENIVLENLNKENPIDVPHIEESSVMHKTENENKNEIEFSKVVEENKLERVVDSSVGDNNKENVDFEFAEEESNQPDSKLLEDKTISPIHIDQSIQDLNQVITPKDEEEEEQSKPVSSIEVNDNEFTFPSNEEKQDSNKNEITHNEENIKFTTNYKIQENDFEFNEVEEQHDLNQNAILDNKVNQVICEQEKIPSDDKVNNDEEFEFKEIIENQQEHISEEKITSSNMDNIITNLNDNKGVTNHENEFNEEGIKHENKINEIYPQEDIKVSENNKLEEDFEFNEIEEKHEIKTHEINNQNIEISKPDEIKRDNSEDFEFNDVEENGESKSSDKITQHKQEKVEEKINGEVDFEFSDVEQNQETKNLETVNHESEMNKIAENKKLDEEDFEFNEVEEVTDNQINKHPEINNNEIISTVVNEEIKKHENKVDEDDFEFNEVEENQDDNQNNILTQNNASNTLVQNDRVKSPAKKAEDDDEFDFVEEEENTIQLNLEDQAEEKKPKASVNDDFDFVEESEESPSEPENNITPSAHVNTQTQFQKIPLGKNSEIISNLFLQYKEKYPSDLIISDKNKYDKNQPQPQQIPSNENIKNFHLDIEKTNLSLKKIISSIPKFKTEPEINIRSLKVEDITSLPKNFENLKKNKKGIKLQNTFSEFSNSSIKKLYFKYIDLKNIYQNSQSVVMSENSNKESINNFAEEKNLKDFKEEVSPFNENLNGKSNKDLPRTEEHNSEEFNEVEEGGHVKTVPSSNIKIEVPTKQKSSALDEIQIPEENEDFNFEKSSNKVVKNKIEIDQALYSIVAPIENLKNEKNDEKIIQTNDNMDNIDNQVQSSQPAYDEDKMIEMLKQLSKNKDSEKIKPERREEEINDEEFSKVIATLPNYNFMLSRFVEYPDSIFNI
jgi:hypothetical protein